MKKIFLILTFLICVVFGARDPELDQMIVVSSQMDGDGTWAWDDKADGLNTNSIIPIQIVNRPFTVFMFSKKQVTQRPTFPCPSIYIAPTRPYFIELVDVAGVNDSSCSAGGGRVLQTWGSFPSINFRNGEYCAIGVNVSNMYFQREPLKSVDVTINKIYKELTFRVRYADGSATRYACNGDRFSTRPKRFALFNFDPNFRDARGNPIKVTGDGGLGLGGDSGIVHVGLFPKEDGSEDDTTKNPPLRSELPVLKAGKIYTNFGLVALDYNDRVISNYNSVLNKVKIANPRYNTQGFGEVNRAEVQYGMYKSPRISRSAKGDYYPGGNNPDSYSSKFLLASPSCPQFTGGRKQKNTMSRNPVSRKWGRLGSGNGGYIGVPIQPSGEYDFDPIQFTNGQARNLVMTDGRGNKINGIKFDDVGLARITGVQTVSAAELGASYTRSIRRKNANAEKYRQCEDSEFYHEYIYNYSTGYKVDANGRNVFYDGTYDGTWVGPTGFRPGWTYNNRGVQYSDFTALRCYANIDDNFLQFIPDRIEIENIKVQNYAMDKRYSAGTRYLASGQEEVMMPYDLTQNNMTYIRTVSESSDIMNADMYATLTFDMKALNEDGQIARGFTSDCFARDIELDVNLRDKIEGLTDISGNQLNQAQSRAALEFFSEKEERNKPIIINDPYGGGLQTWYTDIVDVTVKKNLNDANNGTFIVKADSWDEGEASVKIRLNFKRDISHPINPFELSSNVFNITNVSALTYGTTLNGHNNNNPSNSYASPVGATETRAQFYYGMVYSKDYNVFYPSDNVDANINFAVYCGWVGASACNRNFIRYTDSGGVARTYDQIEGLQGWYINARHDQIKPTAEMNYGCIVKLDASGNYALDADGNYKCLSEAEYEALVPATDAVLDLRLTRNIGGVPVKGAFTDNLNIYRDVENLGGATVYVPLPTNPWLVYVSYFNAPAGLSGAALGAALPKQNGFKVRFTGAGYWAGRALNNNGTEDTAGTYIAPRPLLQKRQYKKIEW